MHPGVVASNFASHGDAAMQAHMAAADTVSPDEPAETLAWLATEPEGGRDSGRYFYRKAEETPAKPRKTTPPPPASGRKARHCSPSSAASPAGR